MQAMVLAVLVSCAACDKPATAARAWRLDADHYLGAAVTAGNLRVWPVFTDRKSELGAFLTLAEAQERGVATVREQEDAKVEGLVIENSGDVPILVCAGALVEGGKQDRQIGQDFVISGKTTVAVDAYCIEEDRWVEEEACDFDDAQVQATPDVRTAAVYDRDQEKVWASVRRKKVLSYPTNGVEFDPCVADSSLVEIAENHRERIEHLGRAIRAHFLALKKRPVGFAYAVNGKPVSVRTFSHARMFAGQFEAFLRAMCLQASLDPGDAGTASARDVVSLVRGIERQREEREETTAGNTNGYRKGAAGNHSSCYVKKGARLVAVTHDWTARLR